MGDSSIRASEDLLDELHELKQRGDTYEDVIWRLIEESRNHNQSQPAEPYEAPREPAPGPTEPEPRQELDLEDTTIDVPGSGDLEERRKDTIIEMAQLLRDRGTAEKDDFLEVVPDDALGYDSKDSFWSNCVKGQDSLKAIPGVQKPPRGRTEWKWAES